MVVSGMSIRIGKFGTLLQFGVIFEGLLLMMIRKMWMVLCGDRHVAILARHNLVDRVHSHRLISRLFP